MLSLYRNPTGEGIFSGHEATVAVNAFASQLGMSDAESTEALKVKIKTLQETITKYKVSMLFSIKIVLYCVQPTWKPK